MLDRNGNNMLDYIAKVENLTHDMKFVSDKLGLQHPKIVHTNQSNHVPYTDAYDEQWMIDKVAELMQMILSILIMNLESDI